jgi:hypothetical protein
LIEPSFAGLEKSVLSESRPENSGSKKSSKQHNPKNNPVHLLKSYDVLIGYGM